MDGKLIIEDCIKIYNSSISFVNSSDGLKIDGAKPISVDQYLVEQSDYALIDRSSEQDQLHLWWQSLTSFQIEQLNKRWQNARPRSIIRDIFSHLKAIYSYDLSEWLSKAPEDLASIFDTDQFIRKQFVTRSFRGAIIKSSLAIKRQLMVLKSNPLAAQSFFDEASALMIKNLDNFEHELYVLCDVLEYQLNLKLQVKNKNASQTNLE